MPGIELPLDTVLEGDCIDWLNALPEKSVDLVFADPPYRLQLQQELWRPNHTLVEAVNDTWDHFESTADYDAFSRAWLGACRRVLKDSGTLWVIGTYHNIYRLGAILQDLDYWILNDVVWIKSNPMPNFRGVRFTNAQEMLIWAQKKRGARYIFNHQAMKALNGDLQMRSDWRLPVCSGKERLRLNGAKAHSTQKPEALLYRVILSSSDPGDIILDPFFGTGTTGVVARRLYRRWIGIEREPAYAALARERIAAVQPGEYREDIYRFARRREQRRIPLGALLEQGLLQPGQTLYLDGRPEVEAVVLANGEVRCRDHTGSIHQVARLILGSPCNGWDRWQLRDVHSGELVSLDRLRQEAQKNLGA